MSEAEENQFILNIGKAVHNVLAEEIKSHKSPYLINTRILTRLLLAITASIIDVFYYDISNSEKDMVIKTRDRDEYVDFYCNNIPKFLKQVIEQHKESEQEEETVVVEGNRTSN